MACRPGEENVATLFGDIHYFYGPQTANPPHHRFDKGSYVYLFENASDGRARIEIANQPGTEEQDAFDGFLDYTHVRYSYKQYCTVSVTVHDVADQEQWHLPTYDPRNENKYHYKLSSLDIYFWTQHDALAFVNGVRRLLPAAQCEVLDEPAPPPLRQSAEMSAVVQKLEKAALTDKTSPLQQQQQQQQQNNAPSFAPPPIQAVAGDGSDEKPRHFAPIAYNPAAPAAPESFSHREKTPPPEDGGFNPLHQTLAHDAATPFSPGLAPTGLGPLSPGVPPPQFGTAPGAPTFAAPPMHSVATPGMAPAGFGQHPGLSRAATMPAHGMPSPGLHNPYAAAGYQAGPPTPGFGGAHRGVLPVQHTPTPPISSPGLPPPPPPGGYSQYSYQHQVPGAGEGTSPDYGLHQQSYRPTEGEASKYHNRSRGEARGRLEENAGRLERGMTGMLKKFEKKFG